MKLGILLVGVLLGLNASADLCTEAMPCGTYEGSGNWYDVNGKKLQEENFPETIEIKPVNETTLGLKVVLRGQVWADVNVIFHTGGQFTIVSDEVGDFGTGFCADKVCTVSFRPVKLSDKDTNYVNSFVVILRFEGNTLKRYNMVANGTDDQKLAFQRSTLTKK